MHFRQKLEITIQFKATLTVFETTLQDAAQLVWLSAQFHGCRFHEKQVSLRKMQKLRLSIVYEKRGETGSWLMVNLFIYPSRPGGSYELLHG